MRTVVLVGALVLAGCVAPPDASDPDATPVRFDAIQVETDLGAFTAILFCGETPKTCVFMRELVEGGYYDGRAFGRIIPGFVIQEVDRTGGTTDQTERVDGEFGTSVMFSAGAIGIARDADPDSGGSEFFVMDFAISVLWGNYTAFAQVVDGLDVVHAIARVPAVKTGPASSVAASPPGSPVYFGVHDRVPIEPVTMTRVTMTTVEMSAAEAARYPLAVGETTVAPAYRATLEWPRDIRAGATNDLVWYVAPRSTSPEHALRDPPPLDLAGASIRAGNDTITPTEDPNVPGILRWSWTPPAPGTHAIQLLDGTTEMAIANVTVG